jgi:hypothetical protein
LDILNNWDFSNIVLNSEGALVSRQKSALKLEVVDINKEMKTGMFFDNERNIIPVSLGKCECKDFLYIGRGKRKKLTPCKHIYRLAMELGVFNVKHHDSIMKMIEYYLDNESHGIYYASYMRKIGRDYTPWGGWDNRVHVSQDQKIRQARAYEMFDEGSHEVSKYTTALEKCTCPDFQARELPCKHIYFLALQSKIVLHVSSDDMVINRKWIFYM